MTAFSLRNEYAKWFEWETLEDSSIYIYRLFYHAGITFYFIKSWLEITLVEETIETIIYALNL
jgi:hypothetical protein